jgi:hypothetical protein
MTLLKRISILSVTGIFIFGTTLFAQPPQQPQQMPQQQTSDVSDKEVELFANSFQKVQQVNQQSQEKMVGAVEKEGLDVQRFNEIQQAQQDPNQDADASEKEMETFDAAMRQLQVIQNQAQQEMQEKITEEGLTIERYQEIISMVQNDVNLQKRLEEHMEE